jgi:hypothetical protein
MSFREYSQFICGNGHYWERYTDMAFPDIWDTPCPICMLRPKWTNHVNAQLGNIVEPVFTEQNPCPCCGSSISLYRPPDEGGEYFVNKT